MNSEGQPNVAPSSDLQEMLTYSLRGPGWISRLIVGAVILLIPIVNFAAWGYAVRVLENVRDRNERLLPEWGSNFGAFWMDGLKLFVIQFLYAIPILIITAIITPIAIASSNPDSSGPSGGATALMVLLGLVMVVYSIALIFLLQGAFVNYANEQHSIGAALQLGRVMDIIRRNWGRMLLIVGLTIVFAFVSGILWAIPCIGWIAGAIVGFLGGFWLLLVMGYNTGLIARNP